MNQLKSKSERLTELDSLRGVAAILVVFFHLTMWHPEASMGFNLGVTGVDLFFLISGFVIFKSLENNVSWKTFIIKRISRLYPAYWACVTFTFLLIFFTDIYHNRVNWILFYNYFVNLYMVQYYFNVPDLDGPYWTMIIELLFYLFILIIIMTKRTARIINLGIAGLVMVSFYSLVMADHFPILFKATAFVLPLIKHFPIFFAGILFYKLQANETGRMNTVLFIVLILACFCLQLSLYNKGAINNNFVTFYEYAGMLGIYFLIFFLFILNLLRNTSSRLTLFLGDISYSLYLVHQYVCLVILLPFFTLNCGLNYWLSSILTLGIVIILAGFITFYIEKPASRKMKEFLFKHF